LQTDYVDPNPDANPDAPYKGDEIISVRTIKVVAMRRYGGAWAAYWADWSQDIEEVVSQGEKLPEAAAKLHFFPSIRGRYDA
jgi:hypothetical protein